MRPVDVEDIRARVLSLNESVWNAEDSRKENRFSVFHHTRHIVARFIPRNEDPLRFYSTPFWAVWQPLLLPVLRSVADSYGFRQPEFPKVMFARLAAGAFIDRHVDGAGSNLLAHKIHVPIETNDGVWFEVGDRSFQLPAGYAYELNNIRPHLIFVALDLAGEAAEPA